MKRLMLIGPSQCGKTSLTQVLHGETLRYQKTQAIVWTPTAIDTPGEYLENRCLYSALLTSACEADVIALVLNADAPWSPFSSGFTAPMNRPVIGVITKADLAAPPRLQQVRAWLPGADRTYWPARGPLHAENADAEMAGDAAHRRSP